MRRAYALLLVQFVLAGIASDSAERNGADKQSSVANCILDSRSYSTGFVRRYCTESTNDKCTEYSCQACDERGRWTNPQACY